jgi:hypothetical protein
VQGVVKQTLVQLQALFLVRRVLAFRKVLHGQWREVIINAYKFMESEAVRGTSVDPELITIKMIWPTGKNWVAKKNVTLT